MFPLVTLLVPIFETMRAAGLLNTYTALILPYVVLNLPVCTLVLVSFFQSIPRDLENAAMIDGCTRMGALVRVVVPLAAPGVFTAGILAFVNAWDEFLLALSLNSQREPCARCRSASRCTRASSASPGPSSRRRSSWPSCPIAVLIALFQERVVGGLTQGGSRAEPSPPPGKAHDDMTHRRCATASSAAAAWAASTSRTSRPCRLGGGARVTALADTHRPPAATLALPCAGRAPVCFDDHRALLASDLCDIVVIATPNFTHAAVLRRRAGGAPSAHPGGEAAGHAHGRRP